MTLAADGQLHAVLHACRNLDLDRLSLAHQTRTVAGVAWVADDFALATALRAGRVCYRPSEQGIDNLLDLALAVAVRTGLDVCCVPGSLSTAVRTLTVALNGDLLLNALGNLIKGQPDSCADVPAFVDSLLGSASGR